jgi:serine/threonine-protein kinase
MSIRDPRSPPHDRHESSGRDPTQSVSLDVDPSQHPSLAIGTHRPDDEYTRPESPGARIKPPTAPPATPRARRESSDPYEIGSILGSYRLVELLGKGGMGFVYRAEHVKLGREVALKLLRSDYARRRDAVMRFFQEAKTVNRVRHRNIVDVTDFVELEDGPTFIIMELLSGTSLGKWARQGVDLPRALAVLVQICDGLGAAHAIGVVHRDLKPDNIVVVPTGDGAELVKLLDFGVAKLVNRDDEDVGFITAAGSVIGTPAYMSPEQAGGMFVDHRSDIYSLGAIMYELFCGQPMFKGRSFGEYVRKHLTEQPIAPRSTQGGAAIDERLEQLILKCLAKDPSDRFGHIVELRDDLLQLLGGLETFPPSYAELAGSAIRSSPMLPNAPMNTTQPTPASPSQLHAGEVAPPPSPAVPWRIWLAGGAIAIGLGIGAAVWWAGRDEGPASEVATAPPPKAPSATPIEPSVAGAPSEFVELRFDSLPSAGVYLDGRSAELCRTPCRYNLESKDGAARRFVIRADGYRDHDIVVDARGAQREFQVTLERAGEPIPNPAAKGNRSAGKSTRADKKQVDPPAVPPVEPTVPSDKPDTQEPKSVDKKPPTIDPVDTLDPFSRRGK